MELTNELMEEIVSAARDIEFGNITISISGQPNKKTVDIITEKRERFRESCADTEGSRYKKDTY